MNYEQRVTCFIDILGFQNHIDGTVDQEGNDKEERIKSIVWALEQVREILDIDKEKDQLSKVVTQFSDCIVISFCIEEDAGIFWTLLEIQWMIVNLAAQGFLCRGGIAYGKLFHSDKLVFGPALVAAYKMESEAAHYPRVILHDSIVKLGGEYSAEHHTPNTEMNYIKSMLSQDTDGMYYVDYIAKMQSELEEPVYGYPKYLLNISDIINSGITNKSPGIRIKYQWLKEKYNVVVQRFHDDEIDWENSDVEKEYKSLPVL